MNNLINHDKKITSLLIFVFAQSKLTGVGVSGTIAHKLVLYLHCLKLKHKN